jgi:hypothetical protein
MAKTEIARKLSLELRKGDTFTEPRVVYRFEITHDHVTERFCL